MQLLFLLECLKFTCLMIEVLGFFFAKMLDCKKNITAFNHFFPRETLNKKIEIVYLRRSFTTQKGGFFFILQILKLFDFTWKALHTFTFSCIKCSLPEDVSLASCSDSSNWQIIFREYSPLYSEYKLVSDCVNMQGKDM